MIKITGGFIIVFACIMISKTVTKERNENFESLISILENLRKLSDEIIFSKKELPEIVKTFAVSKNDIFFKEIVSCLSETKSINEAWEFSCKKLSDRFCTEATEVLLQLGKSIGTLSSELEINNLSYTTEKLSEICKNEKQKLNKNNKLTKSLAVLGGVLIVILFF